jgi:hypothetical protein
MHAMSEPLSELSLEAVWAGLLSQRPSRIRRVWAHLAPPERSSVLAHLRQMLDSEGWQPAQREAARSALEALAAPGEDGPARA